MKRATRVFGYTDIHWSDRDERALAVAEAAQRAFKPDRTIIGGDLCNCGPFSRHPKRTFDEDAQYDLVETELAPASKFIDRVQAHTVQDTVFLVGNHDEWLEQWLMSLGNRGLRSLVPARYFAKDRKAFSVVPFNPRDRVRSGHVRLRPDLIVVHGWATPKYAAQRHLELAKNVSVIFHHTHRWDHRAGQPFRGPSIEAFSAGCLCKRKPIYAHGGSPSDWVHGFWVAYIGRRSYTAYPVKITGAGTVLPDGREVRV